MTLLHSEHENCVVCRNFSLEYFRKWLKICEICEIKDQFSAICVNCSVKFSNVSGMSVADIFSLLPSFENAMCITMHKQHEVSSVYACI